MPKLILRAVRVLLTPTPSVTVIAAAQLLRLCLRHDGYAVSSGGKFVFTVQVPHAYPHESPKVKCKTKVYHPNIDMEGNVCLNILREDWKPVLNINTIVYGLNLLFSQPNDEDPLYQDAEAVLRDNPQKFEKNVQRAMAGGYVGEIHFPRCM